MKEPRHFSNQTSGWQAERALKLHRACLSVQVAVRRGENVGRAIYRVSRRLNGRPFKCDPSRCVALSAKTMRRIWDAWRHGGEVPAAFKLNWNPHRKIVPAPVLVRFAEFCASRRLRSLASAWRQFTALRCNARTIKPLKISDWLLRQYFPTAQFYLMQSKLRTIATAQTELAQIKLKAIGEIRRRLPDRPPRRPYIKRANTFEI